MFWQEGILAYYIFKVLEYVLIHSLTYALERNNSIDDLLFCLWQHEVRGKYLLSVYHKSSAAHKVSQKLTF